MIKIEKTEVFGWEAAIRGMRNPLNSWDKSDSSFGYDVVAKYRGYELTPKVELGENDLALMKKLAKAGSDHGKFLRMINVTMDTTAPLYWWKEFDTYKVGTVANSCSTMHKIHAKEFDPDDFSIEHLLDEPIYLHGGLDSEEVRVFPRAFMIHTIEALNICRKKFIETKDKKYWWQMIQLLPSSYNQKRTVQLNYQVLKQMYFARRNHKLDCWRTLCDWMETLPYFKEIVLDE